MALYGLLAVLLLSGCVACQRSDDDPAAYVNPFIGTQGNGHTFPGACVPFGLVQSSPETGNGSWRYCSGYQNDDSLIYGFSQTHLNGTGWMDLGDLLIQPFTGNPDSSSLPSRFDKTGETASPGYYSVFLSDFGVKAEVTAAARSAYYRFTYPKGEVPGLLLDFQSGLTGDPAQVSRHVLTSRVSFHNRQILTGMACTRYWVERTYYFAIWLDTPFSDTIRLEKRNRFEKAPRFLLRFPESKREVEVKIAFSTVSEAAATAHLEAEVKSESFAKCRNRARKAWNGYLNRIRIEGSDLQKENFYTSMYHLLIQPTNIADADGQYTGVDGKVASAAGGDYFSTLSLWDTYRAAHPLYTLLLPEKVDAFVNTLIAHHRAQGFLPIWTLWGQENYCMIANHAVPVIVDAYLKGFRGFDAEEAYQAVKQSLTQNHRNSPWDMYDKYGYYPFDLIPVESVSRTLESVYDDACAARFAEALGKTDDALFFGNRANYYKNLFDSETRLMRGRDSSGNWRTPFQALFNTHATVGGDYTEGNAWQYTWHVQHDIEGLIALMGGKEACIAKLDTLFTMDSTVEGHSADVTGLIGQYAHGNEPSHHVAYIYTLAGKPSATQALIRKIFGTQYQNRPDGLCGNDDCGQMSAWYLFSGMGFYPVDPCGGEYVIGAPQFPELTIQLPGNKRFVIEARGISESNMYVESVTLNGAPLLGYKLSHQQILAGGNLVFTMTSHPVSPENL